MPLHFGNNMEGPFDIKSKISIELSFDGVRLDFINVDNVPELIPSIIVSVTDNNVGSFMFIPFIDITLFQVNLNNFPKLVHYAVVFISEQLEPSRISSPHLNITNY